MRRSEGNVLEPQDVAGLEVDPEDRRDRQPALPGAFPSIWSTRRVSVVA